MHRFRAAALWTIATLWSAPGALAQEDAAKRPWSNSADLSLVVTGGNSETVNVSLSDQFTYTWFSSELALKASALRTQTTSRTLTNVAGAVRVDEARSTTAEAYRAEARYRHTIRRGFTWYAGAGWERDRFAGIDGRSSLDAGLGYRFLGTDLQTLRAEMGTSVTAENRVGGDASSYAGIRVFVGYQRALSPTSKVHHDLEVLENLDVVEDWRAQSVTSVTASLTSAFALKMSYTLKYDHRPVVVTVRDPDGVDPDAFFEFDETDQVVAASLVINF